MRSTFLGVETGASMFVIRGVILSGVDPGETSLEPAFDHMHRAAFDLETVALAFLTWSA